MDPNETLAELRGWFDEYDNEYVDVDDLDIEVVRDLVEGVVASARALDEWLSKGGFPPKAWSHEGDVDRDRKVVDTIANLLRAKEWPGASGMEDIAEIVSIEGKRDLTPDPSVEWASH